MLISTLIALPLLAAAALAVLPARVGRVLGWAALAAEALLSLRLLDADYGSAGYRFVERAELGPLRYAVGVDGLSLWLVLAMLWLLPCVLLRSAGDRRALRAILLAEATAVGALCAFDLLLFVVFFQLTLLPVLLLAGDDAAARRRLWVRASVEAIAGIALLLGVLWLGEHYRAEADELTHDLVELGRLLLPVETQRGYFLLFALPFLLRLGLPPLHGALQGQLERARPAAAGLSLLLAAPLGLYGLLRVPMTLFPAGSHRAGVTLAAVAACGLVLVGLSALGAPRGHDERGGRSRGIAQLPAAHACLAVLGVFSITPMGVSGALLLSLAMAVALVFATQLDEASPRWLRLLPLVAALGLPPFGGFAGQLLVHGGALRAEHLGANGTPLVCAALLGLTLLGAALLGRPPQRQDAASVAARPGPAWLLPVALLLGLGLHPAPVLERLEPAADHFTRVYTAKLKVSDSHPARRGLLERVPTQ